ncbi:hypothetical protein H1D32_07490 [Anaerobacillus sp. CMMVII]|uniref:hypothetical protein n=1 Tax=Anaerobacillus sp. CMMVII TaxID=2755588 RepID=UPI0021B7DC89|nr:hypothetical protein [Anaerobacillus sp. CMMVII]MCT8137604.1 hypothetical protein [Anaerobacillus sp. CMMVII]
MKKILFLNEITSKELHQSVNKQLEIKNRLLKMLYENTNHRLNPRELSLLQNKYQEQIFILDLIQNKLHLVTNRQGVQEINRLIEKYSQIESET